LHRFLGKALYMVSIVQLVRASDCGSECRGFESHYSPQNEIEDDSMSHLLFFVIVSAWNFTIL
jgi:hypothetical protein